MGTTTHLSEWLKETLKRLTVPRASEDGGQSGIGWSCEGRPLWAHAGLAVGDPESGHLTHFSLLPALTPERGHLAGPSAQQAATLENTWAAAQEAKPELIKGRAIPLLGSGPNDAKEKCTQRPVRGGSQQLYSLFTTAPHQNELRRPSTRERTNVRTAHHCRQRRGTNLRWTPLHG